MVLSKGFMKKKLLATSVLIGLGLSASVFAQDMTSAIRGVISGSSGNPQANATVVIEDTRTGAVRTLQTNDSGAFYATNLPVGGPYRVTVDGGRSVVVDSISLGDIYNLRIDMNAAQVEEVLVLGRSGNFVDVASGPAATYSTFDLATSVAFDRDIKDVFIYDPRLNLDTNSAINCIGKHPRFNSISLDGVSQNDRFGLNDNGYSTATGMPFPFEGVAQVAVELAPFDVTYGGFTACNINAVTKSGSNTWTGTAFFEYNNQDMRGDKLTVDGAEQNFPSQDYTEETRGFSIGGPLMRDRVFFYGAYEEREEPEFIAQGYAGSSNGVVRPWLSKSDFDRINNIASSVYDYDTGGMPSDGAQTEEKYMLRLDWNISEQHDASVIYNFYDGVEDRASDSDSNEFEFANHFYKKGAVSETLTFKLASQWNSALSTDLFVSRNTMDDSQITVGPRDFAEFQIYMGSNTVYLGADDSRQANALNTESDFLKLTAEYLWRDHVVTVGYEREDLAIFNQFVQHARGGEYRFADDSANNPAYCADLTAQGRQNDPNCGLTGIDNFELGIPTDIFYGSGGGTNNAADAAASFSNVLNTLYVQDEFQLYDYNLTLVAGLRYDWFSSDDRPKFNQAFTSLNGGLRNDANIDGLDLLMPRIGFTWEAMDNLTVRGGLGLYSGGNPNVWISNAWSNDGLSNVQIRDRNNANQSVLTDYVLSGSQRPGYDVPQAMKDAVASTTAANASTNFLVLIDPDYEQPSEWKFALGATYTLPMGTILEGDYLYSKQNDPAYYVDVAQDVVGSTTAGQPIYGNVRGQSNYMLTNSSESPDSHSLSLLAKQTHDWGLDWTFGYAYTQAEDVSPMTSAVAGSNFSNLALYDLNNPTAGTSNYESPHRFTARVSYGREFLPGYETRVTAQWFRAKGQPQSWTMSSSGLEGSNSRNRRHLLYVPGPNDPNVVVGPNFDVAAFAQFIDDNGLDQGFTTRNDQYSRWTSRMDLRLDQELPAFFEGAKARMYVKVYNFLNLLNDEWGHQYDAQFFSPDVVTQSVNAQGQYVFERFNPRSISDLQETQSLWQVRLGVQLEF
ncbi:TonB-dependent receptor [Pseudohongiella spirulinae]|uniref:Transporter, OMR family n=1 Tax=Pseudohongiella spirulinae TaxID=1249552 RepID=A0A0S2KBM8_9GAMM|nr:TonB-dependent receptor [Pseudohongiella spirulinae]ALO45739.1 Transporter, OMR family [Pseudohongiella spirulinae]